MRIHYFQHVPFEGPAGITEWGMRHHGVESFTRWYNNEEPPGLSSIDLLCVLGGPMSAYDDAALSWLVKEKRAIENAIKHGKPILGVCLGSQLIADVLGARVYPNREREIGWFDVAWTPAGRARFAQLPASTKVFQWHGDTFDLPESAALLATSPACQNQAFVFDESCLALQFHLETTPQSAAALLENCAANLKPGTFVQTPAQIAGTTQDFRSLEQHLSHLLDAYWAAQLPE